ncbi:hypothetical protein CWI38_0079p0040 [Hamiltosporidium tvaerminnensis]|uniref:Uncharacterized protein n=1 Tax=Hamiltosporidium tvaerminnensis TaxID=1176355 RepID=A0A4V2JYB1_9MICR|nr:hypothetical protein CWI38_0079p0040 [Hamiltosporidium tvaerminnensis]
MKIRISILILLLNFAFLSQYKIQKRKNYDEGDNDFLVENRNTTEPLHNQRIYFSKNISRIEHNDFHIVSYPRNITSRGGSIEEIGQEGQKDKLFCYSHNSDPFCRHRKHMRDNEPFEYEQRIKKSQRSRDFPYKKSSVGDKNTDSVFENKCFCESRRESLNFDTEERHNKRHDKNFDSNREKCYHYCRYESDSNAVSTGAYLQSDNSLSDSKAACFEKTQLEPSNSFRSAKKNRSSYNSINRCPNNKSFNPDVNSFDEMIYTCGRIYDIFQCLDREYIEFSVIEDFIQGDFSINGYFLYTDYRPFYNLIDQIFAIEERFWSKFYAKKRIEYLAHEMNILLMNYNLCKSNSPLLSYFPGIVNIKYFIRNIILDDMDFVRNSCLWILLIKAAESLCNVQPDSILLNIRKKDTVIFNKYKNFNVYNGDNDAFRVLKTLFVIFYGIAKKIYRCAKISRKYFSMLEFVFNNAMYKSIDLHITFGCHVNFSRVIADSIFRMNPEMIISLISELKRQGISNITDSKSGNRINRLFKRLYVNSSVLKFNNQLDIECIYVNIIESYIDFFKTELLYLNNFRDEDSSYVRKDLLCIEDIVHQYKINNLLIRKLDLKILMEISEALCVIFNHFIKVGLNNMLYPDKYIAKSFFYCNKNIKKILIIFGRLTCLSEN